MGVHWWKGSNSRDVAMKLPRRIGYDRIRLQPNDFLGISFCTSNVSAEPTITCINITSLTPSELLKPLLECRNTSPPFQIAFSKWHQDADLAHALDLLRANNRRPHKPHAANKRDELAPPHVPSPAKTAPRPTRGSTFNRSPSVT